MKKQLLILLLTILSINTYSQISFEKGYFINNSNQRTECQIKNEDWRNNPTEFEYRLSENSKPEKARINSVKEFGIYNTSKYFKHRLSIDRSSDKINEMSYEKKPLFEEDELFLKVLVEGKANLYEYVEGPLTRYFYNKNNSDIEQLIHKSYKNADGDVAKNMRFRQQLWNNLKCPQFKLSKIEDVDYSQTDLVRFFTEYSNCNKAKVTTFEQKKERDFFNLSLRPRMNSSSLALQKSTSGYTWNIDFGNKTGIAFGVEAEFILPFNKNKWSLLIEPTYQNFKSEKTIEAENVSGGKLKTEVNYSSIEIPLSLRHYFYLNNNSKIFADISYIFDSSSSSQVKLTRADDSDLSTFEPLEIKSGKSVAFGIGYKLNDKYSLELRYLTSRDILTNYSHWDSDYKTLSVIFGYSIF
ncbi:tRNA modification GTPase [Salegentibacter chungangensis]|uniref:tRNA modification GTPase n=1 Tax=Salegentibacter chungangensis TaxID=1335724 RepID=A0ABW3NRS3_9FLAO